MTIHVLGVGNRHMTDDALGDRVADRPTGTNGPTHRPPPPDPPW